MIIWVVLAEFLVLPVELLDRHHPVEITGSPLPCGAAGSSRFEFNAVTMLNVLRGAMKFLVETASSNGSCGRASEKHGFSLLSLITD